MKARTIALLVATAMAIGSSTFAIVHAGSEADDACHAQQALVDGLYTILDRSTERLPQYVHDGVISQRQADQALADNTAAKHDIVRPSC